MDFDEGKKVALAILQEVYDRKKTPEQALNEFFKLADMGE